MEKSQNQIKLDVIRVTCGNTLYYKLLGMLSGETVRFPSKIEIRNQKIRIDYWNGMNVRELTDKYGLKAPTIYKIIEKKEL